MIKFLVKSKDDLSKFVSTSKLSGIKGEMPYSFPCVCVANISEFNNKKMAELKFVYPEEFK